MLIAACEQINNEIGCMNIEGCVWDNNSAYEDFKELGCVNVTEKCKKYTVDDVCNEVDGCAWNEGSGSFDNNGKWVYVSIKLCIPTYTSCRLNTAYGACMAVIGCEWNWMESLCFLTCEDVKDEDLCLLADGCVWDKKTLYEDYNNTGCVSVHTKCKNNIVDDACNVVGGCIWERGEFNFNMSKYVGGRCAPAYEVCTVSTTYDTCLATERCSWYSNFGWCVYRSCADISTRRECVSVNGCAWDMRNYKEDYKALGCVSLNESCTANMVDDACNVVPGPSGPVCTWEYGDYDYAKQRYIGGRCLKLQLNSCPDNFFEDTCRAVDNCIWDEEGSLCIKIHYACIDNTVEVACSEVDGCIWLSRLNLCMNTSCSEDDEVWDAEEFQCVKYHSNCTANQGYHACISADDCICNKYAMNYPYNLYGLLHICVL